MTYQITTEKIPDLSNPARTVYRVKVNGQPVGHVISKRRGLQWDPRQHAWYTPKKVAYYPIEHGDDPTTVEPSHFANTLKEAARSVATRAGAIRIGRYRT